MRFERLLAGNRKCLQAVIFGGVTKHFSFLNYFETVQNFKKKMLASVHLDINSKRFFDQGRQNICTPLYQHILSITAEFIQRD